MLLASGSAFHIIIACAFIMSKTWSSLDLNRLDDIEDTQQLTGGIVLLI